MILPHNKTIVFEIDGEYYRLSDGVLEEVPDISEVNNDLVFITDMQDSTSGIMSVEAPVKYAEMIVRKQIQESGEFDTTIVVVPHWKKKLKGNLSDVFYTAVPSNLYKLYFDRVDSHNRNVILVTVYRVLLYALKKLKSNKPAAVIFQHGRFVDILIGTTHKLMLANRLVAFDNSPEQMNQLWQNLLTDLSAAEAQNKVRIEKILVLNWIKDIPVDTWPEGKEIISQGEHTTLFHENEIHSGFINIAEELSVSESLSPGVDKVSFFAATHAASFNLFIMLLSFVILTLSFVQFNHAKLFRNKIRTIDHTMKIENKERPLTFSYDNYNKMFSFLKTLHYCRKVDSFKNVVNDISSSFSSDVVLEDFSVKYTDTTIEVKLISMINAPFETANRSYKRILNAFRTHKYSIKQSGFDTRINNSGFFITAEKKL